ncbi:MAG: monovalent cation/H(+) antiporter subunit G [Deltaproteobacteria bacterium]|nr:monovalent cation/H(+) antiporter subunit G [Deltaproteobacteria bacterium]
MAEVLSSLLLLVGASFTLIAAIGVARMPDLFTRLHCSTKSATLGVGCMMLGAAVHFAETEVWAATIRKLTCWRVGWSPCGQTAGRRQILPDFPGPFGAVRQPASPLACPSSGRRASVDIRFVFAMVEHAFYADDHA